MPPGEPPLSDRETVLPSGAPPPPSLFADTSRRGAAGGPPTPPPAAPSLFAASGPVRPGQTDPTIVPAAPAPGRLTPEEATPPGYAIERVLGRGGMGVVYLARQTALNRPVALKMILANAHASEEDRDRFRTEAQAVAALQHPNIVQVFEVGEYRGLPFCALEYLPGGSLDKALAGQPLPPADAAALVEPLARAMHHAHTRGIIHRDLKPANVLLNLERGARNAELPQPPTMEGSAFRVPRSAFRAPKITDFGLAKRLEGGGGWTRTGEAMGTPSYMAPEQAAGKVHELGPGVDVYGLGALLYECLTGRPPFRAASPPETLLLVLDSDPVPPSWLNARLPRDLETICLKCLEKEPGRRYATAQDLADDLARFLRHEPIRARRIGPLERAHKWVRRNPRQAAVGAAILGLLALIGVGLAVWYQERQESASRVREEEQQRAGQILEEKGVVELAEGLAGQMAREVRAGNLPAAQTNLAQVQGLARRALVDPANQGRVAKLREDADRLDRAITSYQGLQAKRREAQYHLMLALESQFAQHRAPAEEAIAAGLAAFGVKPDGRSQPAIDGALWQAQEQKEIAAGCFELLLDRAELAADPAAALALIRQAQGLRPESPAAALRAAKYQKLLGDAAGAAASAAAADRWPATDAVDHFLIGEQAFREDRLAAAAEAFQRALRLQPGHFGAQYYLALCFLRGGQPEAALGFLNGCLAEAQARAERADDFGPWLRLLRAHATAQVGEPAAAERDLEQLGREVGPANRDVRFAVLVNRAVLAAGARRFDQALELLAEAEAGGLDAANRLAVRTNRAQVHLDRGAPAQAAQTLELAVRDLQAEAFRDPAWDNPALPQVQYELGQVYRRLGDGVAARWAFQAVLDLKTAPAARGRRIAAAVRGLEAPTYLALGQVRAQDDDFAGAAAAFRQALHLQPSLLRAYPLLAESLIRRAEAQGPTGRQASLQEALTVLDRYAAAGGPPAEAVARLRGLAALGLNRPAAAEEAFTQALVLERERNGGPWGEALVAAGWVGRAAGPILAPAGPDLVHRQARAQLYFLRGQARQRARNWALARDDYRAAVQALPGWIDAWEKFGLAAAQAGPVARPETWADVWRWAPADPAAPRRWLAEARILAAARTAAQAAGEPGLAREWEGRAIARVAEALCRCPTEADRRELRQEIAADPQLAPLRGNRRFEDLAPPGRK